MSLGERCLCLVCTKRLQQFINQRAAFCKQRAKFKALRESDANTKYFHARASGRRRKNHIATISICDIQSVTHQDKADALTAYYTEILGSVHLPTWNFQLHDLYQDEPPGQLEDIIAPFTEAEAILAIKSMNINSVPSPNSFGPTWYRAA